MRAARAELGNPKFGDRETARDLPLAKWVRVRALAALGGVYAKLGRNAEARTALGQALSLAQEGPGPESPLARQVRTQIDRLR